MFQRSASNYDMFVCAFVAAWLFHEYIFLFCTTNGNTNCWFNKIFWKANILRYGKKMMILNSLTVSTWTNMGFVHNNWWLISLRCKVRIFRIWVGGEKGDYLNTAEGSPSISFRDVYPPGKGVREMVKTLWLVRKNGPRLCYLFSSCPLYTL